MKTFDIVPNLETGPTFQVTGHKASDQSEVVYTFQCLPEIPSGVLLALWAATDQSLTRKATALVSFMKGVLVAKHEVLFDKLIADKDVIVPVDTLGDIVEWLTEVYSGRPTQLPSGSPDGQSPTTDTSTDGSSLPESTPVV